MQNTIDKILNEGITTLGFKISSETQNNFFAFIELLQKWNKVINLTAITETEEIVVKHILDSLAIAPYLKGKSILDFGTGAGLPGIPLALVFPQYNFTLLDSNNKKISFLNQVVLNLKLGNVKVILSKVEQFNFASGFDTIIARAVGSLRDIIILTRHLLSPKGQLLVMKGKYPENELDEISNLAKIKIHQLKVPYLNAERHLVCITLI
jgi:16S rRNA (guanine527-N7)-methyltransferase